MKFFFDVCHIFFDLFILFFDLFRFLLLLSHDVNRPLSLTFGCRFRGRQNGFREKLDKVRIDVCLFNG